MKKSDLTRTPFAGRRVCQFEPAMAEKCHDRATMSLTVTFYPSDSAKPLTGSSLLCAEHADKVVADYKREWDNHPECFERFEAIRVKSEEL